MAQNFIPKTLTVLYSITEEISKIYQLERVMALRSPSKASKFIYSFIFFHSLMSENDKNVPLIVCDFHTK